MKFIGSNALRSIGFRLGIGTQGSSVFGPLIDNTEIPSALFKISGGIGILISKVWGPST